MNGTLLRYVGVLTIFSFLLATLSCGHDQKLVSIDVSPQNMTITGIVTVQYRALGHYIHPPETKDITSTVLWQSSAPSIIDFNPAVPGQAAPTGGGCGMNLIMSAVVYGNPANPAKGAAVVGTTTVNVAEPQLGPPCS